MVRGFGWSGGGEIEGSGGGYGGVEGEGLRRWGKMWVRGCEGGRSGEVGKVEMKDI